MNIDDDAMENSFNLFFEKASYNFLNFNAFENAVTTSLLHMLKKSTYTFLDLINSSIYWKDLDGRILGCNRYMLDLFGLERREQLVGKTDAILISKDMLRRVQEFDQKVIREKKWLVLRKQ